MVEPEAKFHSELFVRLADEIESEFPDYDEPKIEEDVEGRRADIYVPSKRTGEVIIEVKRDDVNPRERDVVKQAYDYARDKDTEYFATCNSRDFFLFDTRQGYDLDEFDYYYFDLRRLSVEEFVDELLRVVNYLFHEDELPEQAEKEKILGILQSFHSTIWGPYEALARDKYGSSEPFRQKFDNWARENDYEPDADRTFEIAAKQYAYLLTNKVLFYEFVRRKTPDDIPTESGFPLDSIHEHTTLEMMEEHLRDCFDSIVEEIDYEAVFDDEASLFEDFPQNRKTLTRIEDFLNNIVNANIGEIDEDLLGGIYEKLIPEKERKELGQYYTPPRIARVFTRYAVDSEDDEVLDPACGSGTITVEAYKRLEELSDDAGHQEILDAVSAVDVNKFPLHLTALNLASQSMTEPTDEINAYNEDFFNLHPMSRESDAGKMGREGDDGRALGKFDAVVANPPYVRYQDLYPSREHFRQHLKNTDFRDSNNRTPYYDGTKYINKQSDLYVYFITHATQFLRDSGRIGFIVPSKWMNVKYGAALQEFLYDHYRIDAVVGFRLRVFEDALVDSVLILAERTEDEDKRRENVVNFVRINDEMSAQDIVDTATFEYSVPDDAYMKIYSRPNYRTTSVRQSYLMDEERDKIEPYLFAPNNYIQLIENPTLVSLNELASVEQGPITGANEFFYMEKEEAERIDIHDRFVKPAIKSMPNDSEEAVLTNNSTDKYIVDVREYIDEVRNMSDFEDSDIENRVKASMRRDGYDAILEYINWGESNDYDNTSKCSSREVWFELEKVVQPEIIHPKGVNEKLRPIWNKDRLSIGDRQRGIDITVDIDERVLLAVLNSNIYFGILECWGRSEGGGSLEIMKYELSSVPVPDIREMSDKTRAELADAYDDYLETGDPTPIDEILVEFLGLDATVEELQKGRELMTTERVESGKNVEVLVEEVEDIVVGDEIEFRKATSDTDLSEFAD